MLHHVSPAQIKGFPSPWPKKNSLACAGLSISAGSAFLHFFLCLERCFFLQAALQYLTSLHAVHVLRPSPPLPQAAHFNIFSSLAVLILVSTIFGCVEYQITSGPITATSLGPSIYLGRFTSLSSIACLGLEPSVTRGSILR